MFIIGKKSVPKINNFSPVVFKVTLGNKYIKIRNCRISTISITDPKTVTPIPLGKEKK